MSPQAPIPSASCTFSGPYYTADPAIAYGFGGDYVNYASFGLSGQFYDPTGAVCPDTYPTVYPLLSVGTTQVPCSPVQSVSASGYTLLCNYAQTDIPTGTMTVFNYDSSYLYDRYSPFFVPITTSDPTATTTVSTDVTVTGSPTPGLTETTTIYDAATNTAISTVTPEPTTTTEFTEIPCSGSASSSAPQNITINSSWVIPIEPSSTSAMTTAPDVACSVFAYTVSPSYYTTNLSMSLGGTGKPILPIPTVANPLMSLAASSGQVVITRTKTMTVQRTTCPANCQAPPPTLSRRQQEGYYFTTSSEGSDSLYTTR